MKSSLRLSLIVSAIALLATGCGGGGGGGGGSDSAPLTPQVQAIASLTTTNQTTAAQDSVSTAFAPFAGAQTLTGVQATDEAALFAIARQQLDKAPEYMTQAKANGTLTGVVQSQTGSCPLGGTMSISVNDADNSGTVSAGDTLNIVADGCVLSVGTATGSMNFTFNTVSGNYQSSASSDYVLGVTMTFGNFTVTSPSAIASMNGSLSLLATANGNGNLSETISTPSLSISATYAGESRTRSLTGYSATMTKAPSAAYGSLLSYTVSGTASSSALASQSVSFATSTPFVRRGSDVYASSGVMVITGGAKSTIKITALNSTQVLQELDANGDGVFEESVTKNWSSLM